MKEKADNTDLVSVNKPQANGQLQKFSDKIIEVNGDRMTPEMLRELISKNPDRVTSALRSWTNSK
ncbi:MAG: hypothetical protein VW879_01700 [Opitutae bacterium]